jgi:hypothetical protein
MLFRDDAPPVWQKLRKEFYNACETYLQVVREFCANQQALEITGSGAWVYKGWESLNKRESPILGTIITLHSYLVYIIYMILVMEPLEVQSFLIQEQHQLMEPECKSYYQ